MRVCVCVAVCERVNKNSLGFNRVYSSWAERCTQNGRWLRYNQLHFGREYFSDIGSFVRRVSAETRTAFNETCRCCTLVKIFCVSGWVVILPGVRNKSERNNTLNWLASHMCGGWLLTIAYEMPANGKWSILTSARVHRISMALLRCTSIWKPSSVRGTE